MKLRNIILIGILVAGSYQAARATIESWTTTAGSNTDVAGTSIAEGMPPSNVNNAMREILQEVARFVKMQVNNNWNADAGSADAYVINPPIAPSSLISGQTFRWKAENTNTGASTLKVGSLSTITVVRLSDTALSAGDIRAGLVHECVYDGTYCQLQRSFDAGSSSANTFTEITTFNEQVRWSKGADIATASPVVLGTDGNYFDVTGTTGFSSINVSAGTLFMLQFDDAAPITVGSGITLNNGGSNYTTAAGDHMIGFATAANTVRGMIIKADGKAVVESGALEFVSTTAITAASTLEITGMAAGYDYIIQLEAFAPTDDGEILWARLSDDGGSTYEADSGDYDWIVTHDGSGARGTDDTEIQISGPLTLGNDATQFATYKITLVNPAGTSENTTLRWRGQHHDTLATPLIFTPSGAAQFAQGANATTAIQFLWSAGSTFKAQGDITVWRRKRS